MKYWSYFIVVYKVRGSKSFWFRGNNSNEGVKGSGFSVWGETLLRAHSNESSIDNTMKLMLDISIISTQQYSSTSRLMLMTAIYFRTLQDRSFNSG